MVRYPVYLSICLCGMMALAGCERAYILPAPTFSPVSVVMSHFAPGQPFQVRVSKIMSLDHTLNPEYPDDAIVGIYAGDNLLGHLQYGLDGNGVPVYQNNQFLPQEGIEYTLKVQAPDMPEAVASSSVPGACGDSVTIVQLAVTDSTALEMSYVGTLAIHFSCVNGGHDYFQVSLREVKCGYTIVNNDTLFHAPDTMVCENYGGNFNGNPYVYAYGTAPLVYLFSENALNGQSIQMRFNAVSENAYPLRKLLVEVRHISKEYYQFYRSLLFQSNPNDQNFFTDPQTYYNNILNGAGNFSGYRSQTIAIPWVY